MPQQRLYRKLRQHVPVLSLKCFRGLKVNGVSQILPLFQNIDDGGGTPAIYIFEGLILVHALAMLCKVTGQNEDFFFFQLAGDLIRKIGRAHV